MENHIFTVVNWLLLAAHIVAARAYLAPHALRIIAFGIELSRTMGGFLAKAAFTLARGLHKGIVLVLKCHWLIFLALFSYTKRA